MLPFFNVDKPILPSPIINIAKQELMNLAQSGRCKIRKTALILDHHVGAGLLRLDQIKRFLIPNVQFVFQDRNILV